MILTKFVRLNCRLTISRTENMNSLPHVRSHFEWRHHTSTEAMGLAAEIPRKSQRRQPTTAENYSWLPRVLSASEGRILNTPTYKEAFPGVLGNKRICPFIFREQENTGKYFKGIKLILEN